MAHTFHTQKKTFVLLEGPVKQNKANGVHE